MKNKLMIWGISFILLLFIVFAVDDSYYKIDLDYDEELITFSNAVVMPGVASDKNVELESDYRAELLSFRDDVLYSFNFDVPLISFSDEYDPETEEWSGEVTLSDELEFSLGIPYFNNGKTVKIYEGNSEILSIDVGYLADVCGDSICQPHETSQTCPQDCSFEVKSSTIKEKSNMVYYILGILMILFVFFLIYRYKRNQVIDV